MKRIAYITDLHLEEKETAERGTNAWKNWSRIRKDLSERQIDEVIIGGDLGDPSALASLFASLEAYPFRLTPGNHDRPSVLFPYLDFSSDGGTGELYDAFGDQWTKSIFLDSSSARISPQQMDWLRRQLQTDKQVLLFVHHPVLPVDTAVDRAYPLENRDEIKEELHRFGRTIYLFCGHYHLEDERLEGNIRQFITPAVSFQVIREAPRVETHNRHFGYRLITIEEAKVETEVVVFQNKEAK